MNYIPLHVYTEYTFLSSSLKLEDLFSIASINKYKALGISDFNNVYAYPSFYHLFKKSSITPIFGMSLNLTYNDHPFYVVVYIKNEDGYRNICQLVSKNNTTLTLDEFYKYSEGLILVLPCVSNSYIKNKFNNDDKNLSSFIFEIQKHFSSFYLGIEIYSPDDVNTINKVRNFASNHSYKTICFPRHQYYQKKDAKVIQILKCIKENTKFNGDIDEITGPYYFLSEKAINNLYLEEEIKNTYSLLDEINFNFLEKRGSLYVYDVKGDKKEYIYNQCLSKLNRLNINDTSSYIERLNYELDVISKMGYLDYFLIVADYVNYAKNHNIPIGPGRGSAVGSLVSYLLNITEIDPLEYDLYFERFLNPERTSMPDIDIDVADYKREDLIHYIEDKYSKGNTSLIVTFQTIGAKQAIRDSGRVLNYNVNDINIISNYISIQARLNKNYTITLKEVYDTSKDLRDFLKEPYFKKLFDIACLIEGLPRQSGLHAAGILLNKEKLNTVIPVSYNENNEAVCQYEKDYLEEQGFLKMDVLGLRNLSIIEDCIYRIKKDYPSFSLQDIKDNDLETFDILNKGYTKGIFQLESSGMTNTLKQVNISSLDDIIATNALFRPGPMEYIKVYAERKNNHLTIDYVHPSLEKILKPTYGVIVYQEQIMQIVKIVANYSLGKADLFRRAISKKDETKLLSLKEDFINSSLKNNYSKEDAQKIYDTIYKFASYGFNKSHSVAYSYLAYQMAYLKTHYSTYFYGALFDFTSIQDESFSKFTNELKHFNISLKLPSINKSSNMYELEGNNIIIPFTLIKGLPTRISEDIVNERYQNGPYTSFVDLICRLQEYNVKEEHIISLINAGALDEFNYNRNTLRKNVPVIYQYAKGGISQMSLLSKEEALLLAPVIKQYKEDEEIKLQKELETLGLLLSGSFLSKYDLSSKEVTPIEELELNKPSSIACFISQVRVIKTKAGKEMAFVSLYDDATSIDGVIFNEAYEKYKIYLLKNRGLLIKGSKTINRNKDDEVSFMIDEVSLLKEKL
jgi:DNA polymerase III subunit alpha